MKYLNLFLLIIIISCSNDDNISTNETIAINDVRVEVPCDFDFNNLSPDETIVIGCDYDLNGQTISLPENIKIQNNGGNITNGKLIFNGGLIDGKLLNLSLEIEGDARLIDTDFTFNHSKWGITEGEVSDEVALVNRENINIAITQVKYLRGYTFIIDNIDAYLQITAAAYGNTTYRESIQIPSNFHFKMGDDCHLRTQPHALPSGSIITARIESNIKVSGGHLYGDKMEHTYTQGITGKMHDSGFGVYFISVRGGIVDGVEMKDFIGDGFSCHSLGLRNDDGTPPSGLEHNFTDNIVVRNCTFDSNRRNNLSVIDGTNIIIEDNLFLKAGETDGGNVQGVNDTVYSWIGVIPGNGIDFEAWRRVDEDGNTRHTQFINDVIVRNNVFKNGRRADINLFTCSNLDIYGNDFDSSVSNKASFNVKIHDNNFINNTAIPHQNGISIKQFIREQTGEDINVNHQIYNNTIKNYNHGIFLGGTDQKIFNNTIINCINDGVFLGNGANNEFYNNIINSNVEGSKGYFGFPTGIEIINTTITNETINVKKYGMLLLNVNGGAGELVFNNCHFQGNFRNVDIRESNDITITNSSTGTIYQTNNTNIVLENNN